MSRLRAMGYRSANHVGEAIARNRTAMSKLKRVLEEPLTTTEAYKEIALAALAVNEAINQMRYALDPQEERDNT